MRGNLTNTDHEWRFYWDRSEFSGTDLFELHPGDFPDGEIVWWSKGSAFVREENFEPFGPTLHRLIPDFDWHGETKISPANCKLLRAELVAIREAVDGASTMEQLIQAFDCRRLFDEGLTATQLRQCILVMIDDFIGLLDEAIERNEPFWLLGL